MIDIYYIHNVVEKRILESIEIDMYDVMEIITGNFEPEDIFSESDLMDWAKDNGYVHDSLVKEYHNE